MGGIHDQGQTNMGNHKIDPIQPFIRPACKNIAAIPSQSIEGTMLIESTNSKCKNWEGCS